MALYKCPQCPHAVDVKFLGHFPPCLSFPHWKLQKSETVASAGYEVTALQLIPASHSFLTTPDSSAEQSSHIFLQRGVCTPALTLEARKTIPCSFNWSPNELNFCHYAPNEGGCEGFSDHSTTWVLHTIKSEREKLWKKLKQNLCFTSQICSHMTFFGGEQP